MGRTNIQTIDREFRDLGEVLREYIDTGTGDEEPTILHLFTAGHC